MSLSLTLSISTDLTKGSLRLMSTLIKVSEGKIVYDGDDGYVYSKLCDLKELYAAQYATFRPNDKKIVNYMKHLEKAYQLAEKYLGMIIVEIDHTKGVYITKCPKYDGDLNQFFSQSYQIKSKVNIDTLHIVDKIIDLIVYLKQNNIINDDIAFRNICYRISSSTEVNEITLYMIDFEQLRDYDKSVDDNYDVKYDEDEGIELYLTCLLHDLEVLDNNGNIKSYFLKNLYEKIRKN